MSAFTFLDIRGNGDETFTLIKPLVYRGSVTIKVERGFRTDFASIPRVFRVILSPYGRHTEAAVLHDWLYQTSGMHGEFTRKQCDELFFEAMIACGVGKARALTMYSAVRAFGWMFFRK